MLVFQQVAAKDTEIGTWSDWSVAVHATPWIEDPLPITSTTEVDFPTGRSQPQLKLVPYFLNLRVAFRVCDLCQLRKFNILKK